MKKTIFIVLLFCSRFIYGAVSSPLNYPNNESIQGNLAYFIWEDIYTDSEKKAQYNLVIKRGDSTVFSTSFTPTIYDMRVYSLAAELKLENGNYTYEIASKPDRRYFGFRKYPISGSFTVDNNISADLNDINPENYSRFIYMNHYNRNTNYYDSIFFAAASTISLTAGVTIYMFFNINIYTAVLSYAMMGAAAVGYPASAYYAYEYVSNRNKYRKIYLEQRVSFDFYYTEDKYYGGVTSYF